MCADMWQSSNVDFAGLCNKMCLVMNELARTISGVKDDWWK